MKDLAQAERMKEWMEAHFVRNENSLRVCKLDMAGARVAQETDMNLYNIRTRVKTGWASLGECVRVWAASRAVLPRTLEPLADGCPTGSAAGRALGLTSWEHLLGDEVPAAKVSELIDAAFTFPAPW